METLEQRLQREGNKIASSFESFDSFFAGLEPQREKRAIYEYEAELIKYFEEKISNLVSHTISETIKEAVRVIEGEKKKVHKEVERQFWYDGDKFFGEFEMYGEYEPFFKFAKKMRTTALTTAITVVEGLDPTITSRSNPASTEPKG